MSAESDLPEPDRVEPAPHPRFTAKLFGQGEAEETFLSAYNAKRLHHAWLLTGPRGVGKATLAWRVAKFLLATPTHAQEGFFGGEPPPKSLDVPSDSQIVSQIEALSAPGVFLLRRTPNENTGRLSNDIRVDDVRRLRKFFNLSATNSGARVVIIDAADEMNTSAANAFLKMLEEPPTSATLLLISHQPARLLPTIRSRCRTLALRPLDEEPLTEAVRQALGGDLALTETDLLLAGGSPGEAVRLVVAEGGNIYSKWLSYLEKLPGQGQSTLVELADTVSSGKAEGRFETTLRMLDTLLARLARFGATGGSTVFSDEERQVFSRLAPNARAARVWAELQQSLGVMGMRAAAVNLDPAAVILDMGRSINETAAKVSGRS